MSKSKQVPAGQDDDLPTGKPLYNPLTAEHYAGVKKVIERGQIIEDAIQRATHLGLEVGPHAAQHEMHQKVARRILLLYPEPPAHPLAG